jgi:hypothetical protein
VVLLLLASTGGIYWYLYMYNKNPVFKTPTALGSKQLLLSPPTAASTESKYEGKMPALFLQGGATPA